MDRDQHVVQDAAEHYAVYIMQKTAEKLGIAASSTSSALEVVFRDYLRDAGLTKEDFFDGKYRQYRLNAELQLPNFVNRLQEYFDGRPIAFETVERDFRNRGLKGDFTIDVARRGDPIAVSLKNYVGKSGITRPQVGSGTFASFAAGFVFERVGVGKYADPRDLSRTFQGSNAEARNAVLRHMGRESLIKPLEVLDECQAEVRKEFLGDECEYYDGERVARAARRVAAKATTAVLEVFSLLGKDVLRTTFLERAGLDGKEQALFFDSERYVDSITSTRYHQLRQRLNAEDTQFSVARHGQGLRFEFSRADDIVLKVDVPFTINPNGAWYRPRERYSGTRVYYDKGREVALAWGQRRPYKSREIATSTNMYVDLAAVGIFGD